MNAPDTAAPVFDFENAGTWEVGETILPAGEYAVEITSAEGGFSTSGLPQVEVLVSCAQGTRKDWITYGSPNDTKGIGVRKVNTLFLRAGVQLLNTDLEVVDGKPRIADAKVKQLVGRRVGVTVRKEKEEDEYPRIVGYVPVETITGNTGTGGATASADGGADIPF